MVNWAEWGLTTSHGFYALSDGLCIVGCGSRKAKRQELVFSAKPHKVCSLSRLSVRLRSTCRDFGRAEEQGPSSEPYGWGLLVPVGTDISSENYFLFGLSHLIAINSNHQQSSNDIYKQAPQTAKAAQERRKQHVWRGRPQHRRRLCALSILSRIRSLRKGGWARTMWNWVVAQL